MELSDGTLACSVSLGAMTAQVLATAVLVFSLCCTCTSATSSEASTDCKRGKHTIGRVSASNLTPPPKTLAMESKANAVTVGTGFIHKEGTVSKEDPQEYDELYKCVLVILLNVGSL